MLDKLAVEIEPCLEDAMEGGALFLVHVFVNGEALPDVLDVDVFFNGLDTGHLGRPERRAGKNRHWKNPIWRMPPFNCSCGVFGCGGYYVDVTVAPNALIWANHYRSMSLREEPVKRWRGEFAWENVVAVAGEILAGICVAQARSPNGEVRYGTSGVEVTERLPFYRERRESLKTRAQK